VAVVEFGGEGALPARTATTDGLDSDPDDPRFNDQAERCAAGDLRGLRFHRADVEANAERTYRPGQRQDARVYGCVPAPGVLQPPRRRGGEPPSVRIFYSCWDSRIRLFLKDKSGNSPQMGGLGVVGDAISVSIFNRNSLLACSWRPPARTSVARLSQVTVL
jgi:hypothetical protein